MRGEDILKTAKKHVGEKYVLGTFVPKDNAAWKGPWDCAEFVSWCVFQTAGILFGCERDDDNPSRADAYTGYWGRDAKAKGTVVGIAEAARIPGAAILRAPEGGHGGHIVLSDGKGGTVEAHGQKDGVVQLKIAGRSWDTGILVPGIEYAKPESVPEVGSPAVAFRLATPYMQGPTVRAIQTKLKAAPNQQGPDP